MFFKNYLLKEKLKHSSYFIWKSQNKSIKAIKNFKPLNLDLIIGVDNQKNILFKNTINFLKRQIINKNNESKMIKFH